MSKLGLGRKSRAGASDDLTVRCAGGRWGTQRLCQLCKRSRDKEAGPQPQPVRDSQDPYESRGWGHSCVSPCAPHF